MKRCPKCHAKIYQEDDYCYNCGYRISTIKKVHTKSIEDIPVLEGFKSNYNNDCEQNKRSFGLIIAKMMLVCTVFLIVYIGVTVFNANDLFSSFTDNNVEVDVSLNYESAIKQHPEDSDCINKLKQLSEEMSLIIDNNYKNTQYNENLFEFIFDEDYYVLLGDYEIDDNKVFDAYISVDTDFNYVNLNYRISHDQLNEFALNETDKICLDQLMMLITDVNFDKELYQTMMNDYQLSITLQEIEPYADVFNENTNYSIITYNHENGYETIFSIYMFDVQID